MHAFLQMPVFSHACLGLILFHIHVKNPSFFELGIFHGSGNSIYSADQALSNRERFSKIHSRLQASGPPSVTIPDQQ
ncbi:hypothetical protein BK139_20135 [Paenibacillus sp. FSL R5-0490]|nr:hypothetical protein BK139_20135 [Paenibacillus sp. FSL R5-0490]